MTRTAATRPRQDSALYRLPEAARLLSVSGPTLKQWILKGKVRSVRTPGGHHRIPRAEVDRLSGQRRRRGVEGPAGPLAAISGRNKLFGRISRVRFGDLLAEITIAIGDQELTAVITRESVRSMGLKVGMEAYGLIKATEVMVIRA